MKKLLEFKESFISWAERKIEKVDKKWEKEYKPQIIRVDKPPEYLEGRVVFCGNCERNQTLFRNQGLLVCSVCCSDNWVFPITIRPKIDEDILKKVLRPSGHVESKTIR